MLKAFKYRAYPNKKKALLMDKNIHSARFMYNKLLEEKIVYYKTNKEMLYNTPAMYKGEHHWLREVDSLALANAQLHVETAFKNFFRDKKIGFPNFKSRHKTKWSYTTNVVGSNIKVENGKIRLPKVGWVKIKYHRNMIGKLKSVTITKTRSGKYYVSCLCEYEADVEPVKPETFIGLDFSMPHLYIDSNGDEPEYPQFYRKSEEKLVREMRKLSLMEKGSSNRNKQRIKVARLMEHIANQRKDFLHKLSTEIANRYDCVGIESLDMKAMSQALNFGKSVHDNGWGMFTTFLEYKLAERGKFLIKIDKWFPSTKACSECGSVKPMPLNERMYVCPECGSVLPRDVNAAINICNEAKRTVGHTGIARTTTAGAYNAAP